MNVLAKEVLPGDHCAILCWGWLWGRHLVKFCCPEKSTFWLGKMSILKHCLCLYYIETCSSDHFFLPLKKFLLLCLQSRISWTLILLSPWTTAAQSGALLYVLVHCCMSGGKEKKYMTWILSALTRTSVLYANMALWVNACAQKAAVLSCVHIEGSSGLSENVSTKCCIYFAFFYFYLPIPPEEMSINYNLLLPKHIFYLCFSLLNYPCCMLNRFTPICYNLPSGIHVTGEFGAWCLICMKVSRLNVI